MRVRLLPPLTLIVGLAVCGHLAASVQHQDGPSTAVVCNGIEMAVVPPVWARMIGDEAHFVCSPRYELKGQKILACIDGKWNFEPPSCSEIPKTTIKMKCPYNHSDWSLANLNNIMEWVNDNRDKVTILDDEFIEDSDDSRRMAAEMFARMNDPFFRFHGKLTTYEKGVPLKYLIEKFKRSSEFRSLVKQMAADDDMSNFSGNDLEDETNVLVRFYGNSYMKTLEEIIRPYDGLIEIRENDPSFVSDTLRGASAFKENLTPILPVEDPDISLEINPHYAAMNFEDTWNEPQYEALPPVSSVTEDLFSVSEEVNHEKLSSQETLNRQTRQRGDVEKLLPSKTPEKDYFGREIPQVLTGVKAEAQTRSQRTSYITHLRSVVEHILKHKVDPKDWPPYLKQFSLEEIMFILDITNKPIPPPRPIECPAPWSLGYDLVKNGRVYQRGTERLIIQCNMGYENRGPQELFCRQGSWVPPGDRMPKCEPSQANFCISNPPAIRNSVIVRQETNFVVIDCLAGYKLRGSNMLRCDNEVWRSSDGFGFPSCEKDNSCGSSPTPYNGFASEPHYLSDNKTLVVRYYCHGNLTLQGNDYSICQSGQWPIPPICSELVAKINPTIDPRMPPKLPSCPPLSIPNGRYSFYDDGRQYVRAFCPPGYILEGSEMLMCVNGAYQGQLPRCVSQSDCPRVSPPLDGNVTYITSTAVKYSCNPGYRLEGRSQTTCYQGNWQDPAPRCVRNMDGGCDPREPVKGSNAIVFAYRDGRWFECILGYQIIGTNVQTCLNGYWGPEPQCISPPGSELRTSTIYYDALNCPLPIASGSDLEVISRGKTIHYRCRDRSFILSGPLKNTCPDNRWLAESPPRCIPTYSTTQRPSRVEKCIPNRIFGGDAYLYSEGRVIYYQCKTGYRIRGATTLHCEKSQWTEEVPSCVPEASVMSSIEFGEIYRDAENCPTPSTFPGTTLNVAARGLRTIYTCFDGSYTENYCRGNLWEGRTPSCNGIRPPMPSVCEPLEVSNGKFFSYGERTAIIQCNPNHVLAQYANTTKIQSRITICDPETGRWDIKWLAPSCIYQPVETRPTDASPPDPSYGASVAVEGCPPPEILPAYTYYINSNGRHIDLGCAQRRQRRSVGSIVCVNATWQYSNNSAPTCDPSACGLGDQKLEKGLYYVYNGSEFVFQCNRGYNLVGYQRAICPGTSASLLGGTNVAVLDSSFRMPICEPTTNDPRPQIRALPEDRDTSISHESSCGWSKQFGSRNNNDYFIYSRGSAVQTGEKIYVCQSGEWIEKSVFKEGCSTYPAEPDHGTFFVYQTNVSVYVYFQCLTGYTIVGNPIRECSGEVRNVPICKVDEDRFSRNLIKDSRNAPSENRCSLPPTSIQNGALVIQSPGNAVTVYCRPGYRIEGTRSDYARLVCQNEFSWRLEGQFTDTTSWPRCVRVGDTSPIDLPKVDLFGRPLPQVLTGEKAALQESLHRKQYRDHALMLAQLGRERVQALSQRGDSYTGVRLRMPMSPSISDQDKVELERRYSQDFADAKSMLATIYDQVIQRRRRKIHLGGPVEEGLYIPEGLEQYTATMKEYNFTQDDILAMVLMDDSDRAKYIEEKRKARTKTQDDPKKSQDFVKNALSSRKANKKNSFLRGLKSSKTEPIAVNTSIPFEPATNNASPLPDAALTNLTEFSSNEIDKTGVNASTSKIDLVDTEASTTEPVGSSITAESNITLPSVVPQPKKGYDLTCAYNETEAPAIENGFVVSYELLEGPEGLVVRASYRCDPKYRFEFNHTSSLKCKNGGWVGERPKCIINEEDDDDDDDEGLEFEEVSNNSQIEHNYGFDNALKK